MLYIHRTGRTLELNEQIYPYPYVFVIHQNVILNETKMFKALFRNSKFVVLFYSTKLTKKYFKKLLFITKIRVDAIL